MITADSKGQLLRKIEQMAIEYPVVVDIQHGDIRTVEQNKRYWACIVAGVIRWKADNGEVVSQDSVHKFLKQQRYGKKVIQFGEHVQEVEASSRKFTKKRFNEFMEWAEAFLIDEVGVPYEYFISEQEMI